jgi:hypothetical protein
MRHTSVMRRRQLLFALATLAPVAAAQNAWANDPPKANLKKGGGTTFVQIQTLTATVTRMGGRRGVMTVDAGLDIPDGALRERAQLSIPRLRAAYVQAVSVYAAGLPAARAPDADFIAGMLQRLTDTQLGRKGAKLLIGAIMIA